ncbi:MAG TPA: hypothetical protein DHW40_06055 [Microbacterium sp.]|nr:hypothetical protein [Microbacterium sp.]
MPEKRAAESEAKAMMMMMAEVDASVEADEILRDALSKARIRHLETEELYERAKADVAAYLASDKVDKTVEDASPTLWMRYLRAEPKVEAHFKKWARDVHRIDDVYNLDPRTPMGKPHGKRIEAIRASLNEQTRARKARIDFERG